MHFYGHTLSDIPKRTRNTKQDAVRCILRPFLTINLNIREREREKCCLTCKNNVGISRTFFSIQTAIKTSIPFLFLTRHVYSVTNIPCHRYCLVIEFYIHWVYKYDEVNKLSEQTFLERYYISFPFLLRNKIFVH